MTTPSGVRAILVILAVFTAVPLTASDTYMIQGHATGAFFSNRCEVSEWLGDAVFHNATATAQTITLLDISNGPLLVGVNRTLTIQPGRTASINRSISWTPGSGVGVWVIHLDVPDGVTVESRFEIGGITCQPSNAPVGPRYGKLSLPIYHALQPAGVAKVHVGTDLGLLNARNNIAIFNASPGAANAHVEIHQGCDDALLTAADVVVPANTTQQFPLGSVQTSCPPFPGVQGTTNGWITYVVVIVDQPSLSWVSTLSNALDLNVPYAVSSSE